MTETMKGMIAIGDTRSAGRVAGKFDSGFNGFGAAAEIKKAGIFQRRHLSQGCGVSRAEVFIVQKHGDLIR